MRALLTIWLALTSPAPPTSLAIEWREGPDPDSQSDEATRRAVREQLARRDGRPADAIPEHAYERAAIAVSRELPIELRELGRQARASLDRADEAYRQARFDDALRELGDALDQLHAQPAIPGAAASAREAHLLAAKIAWARSDAAASDLALRAALRLDPEAMLSVREAAPALVDRYRALQRELLAARDHGWQQPSIPSTTDNDDGIEIEIEIDGVIGLRPVPPGEHFVIVYRLGRQPVAAWTALDGSWTPPRGQPRLADAPEQAALDICEALALDRLVFAERRGARVGIQVHDCEQGFGPRWVGPREQLDEGLASALAGPFGQPQLTLALDWPALRPSPEPAPVLPPEPPTRPWYRRGWIWGTSASVAALVVGGVVTGVVLAGREGPRPRVQIDGDQFIGSP